MPNPQSGKKRLGKKHRQAATRPHKGTGVAAGKRGESKAKAEARGKGRVAAKAVAKKKAGKNAKGSPTVDKPQVSMKRTAFSKDRVGPTDWRLEDAAVEAAAPNERLQHATHAALGLLPLIAICGRPNVGKSTLFNRLTRTRRSIVGDEPGITRDRIYGLVEWSGQRARIVDTGGVVPDDDELIPSEIYRQARVALHEADAIVMVVDGRTELASPDIELARLLQRSGKPVFLAVNKMDTEQMEVQAQNFRRLGLKEVLPISAEHGSGIGDLLDAVFAVLPNVAIPVDEEPEEEVLEDEEIERLEAGEAEDSEQKLRTHGEYDQHETKIAIIGRPNVGKSTLLNALTGTSRAIVSPVPGTTRDAVDEVVERDNALYRFVDTAGIRRKGKTKLMAEKLSVVMARKHLEAADVSLLVIDAVEGVTALDANIGGYAHESGRSVVIVVNKWDLVTGGRTAGKPPAEREIFEEQVRDSLKYLEYAPMVFVTAIKGKNIDKVFEQVQLVARERRKRITTGQMNRFLEKVDFERASVPVSKRVRIFYMTQAAVAPPTFILFTDRDVKLHFSYERFLANQIRKEFGFVGSPIWFKVRARTKKN